MAAGSRDPARRATSGHYQLAAESTNAADLILYSPKLLQGGHIMTAFLTKVAVFNVTYLMQNGQRRKQVIKADCGCLK